MAVLNFNAFVEESLFQLLQVFLLALRDCGQFNLSFSPLQLNSICYRPYYKLSALSPRPRLNRTNLSSALSALDGATRLHHSPTFLQETHNGSYDQMRPSSMPDDRTINAIMRNNGDVWHVYCDAPPLLPEPLRRTAERT